MHDRAGGSTRAILRGTCLARRRPRPSSSVRIDNAARRALHGALMGLYIPAVILDPPFFCGVRA